MLQKLRLIGLGALLLAQMSLPVFANNLTATVVSVGDGDTIRVNTGNKTLTVRLACIDAPEMKQNPWGHLLPRFLYSQEFTRLELPRYHPKKV